MKIPAGFISLSLLLLLKTPATAQPIAGARQATSHSWDTIFFSLPIRRIHDSVATPGLGKVFAPMVSYTFTQSGNSLLVRKEVVHYVDDGARPVTDTSNWLRTQNDTLLKWIDQHATIIKGESIAPFIYSWKSEEGMAYEEMRESHPDIYSMVFITSGKEVRKTINNSCFEKSIHQERTVNLNFNYNTSTRIYQLFKQLDQLIPQWDQQFTFPNKNSSTVILPAQHDISSFSINESPSPSETDTIYFSMPFNYAYNYNMPGLGTTMIPDVGYVMVKKNNQIVTWKHVTYSNDDGSEWLSVNSGKLYIDNDTLFSWLSANLETIRQERLQPFVYKVMQGEQVMYITYSPPHQPRYTFFIGISNTQDDIRKDIPLDLVKEQATHGPVITNLNYTYNINTKLYQLYLMVAQRCEAWDLQYIFSKKGK